MVPEPDLIFPLRLSHRLLLRQPPQLIAQLIGCMLIQKMEETIAHLPSPQATADLILGNEHDPRVCLALRAPCLVYETEVALGGRCSCK
jgi:hypothetical protein